jgi:tetratricopeptide (TPR) repeat protein
MTMLHEHVEANEGKMFLASSASMPLALPAVLGPEASNHLQRMFRDPRLLEPEERKDLIDRLREALELTPNVPEVRVILGMALCVDLQVQEAMEEMREALKQAPDSFIARLKFGELLMRLRICDQAEVHTQEAARLASNPVQSDLARRQATTIRTMRREGIERGVLGSLRSKLTPRRGKSRQQDAQPILASSK